MGIFLAAWLAAAARTELNRFVEFMHFLRYGMCEGPAHQPLCMLSCLNADKMLPFMKLPLYQRRLGITETRRPRLNFSSWNNITTRNNVVALAQCPP